MLHVCVHEHTRSENKHNAGAIANDIAKDTSTDFYLVVFTEVHQ